MVAIIGILAAVAIPTYQNFTDRANNGVAESAVQAAARLVYTNQATNANTVVADLNKIKSKGVALSSAFLTEPATILPATTAWCISFAKTGINGGKVSCIDDSGNLEHGSGTAHTAPAGTTCTASSGLCI